MVGAIAPLLCCTSLAGNMNRQFFIVGFLFDHRPHSSMNGIPDTAVNVNRVSNLWRIILDKLPFGVCQFI